MINIFIIIIVIKTWKSLISNQYDVHSSLTDAQWCVYSL